MTSATTPVYSPLYIVSACPPFLVVPVYPVSAMYFSASAAFMLLLPLPPILVGVLTTATALALSSEHVSLVDRLTVIDKVDIVCYHLYTEGCV